MPKPTGGRPVSARAPTSPPPGDVVSKSAFARWIGVHPPRVNVWVDQGRLTPRPDGRIAAMAGLAELLKNGAVLPASDDAAPADAAAAPQIAEVIRAATAVSYDDARAFTEVLRAHRAHLDLRERHGELVRTDLADGLLFDAGRRWRDAWLTWPARISALMASELGVAPAALMAALDRHVREHLTEMADPSADWRTRARETRRDAA